MAKFWKPPENPAFWPHFLRPGAKNQNYAFNSFLTVLPFPKRCDTTPPDPKCWEEKDMAEKAVFGGPGADLEDLGAQTACPKITCKELGWLSKFGCYPTTGS